MNDLIVDSRGRRCPLPIIDLARAARTAPPGSLITLISNDPAAAADVAAWCRMRSQTYEGSSPGEGDAVEYRIRLVSG